MATSTERVKRWKARNYELSLERGRAYSAKQRLNNPEAIKKAYKKWYDSHKAEEYARVTLWKKANPESVKKHNRNSYLARKMRNAQRP